MKGKKKCKTAKRLFSMLSHKFKPFHNRIVLSLQELKLKIKSHESTQEWMGRLQRMAADCDYNEYNSSLCNSYMGYMMKV